MEKITELQTLNTKKGNKAHPSRLITPQIAFRTQDSKAKMMTLKKMEIFLKIWKIIKNSQQFQKAQETTPQKSPFKRN